MTSIRQHSCATLVGFLASQDESSLSIGIARLNPAMVVEIWDWERFNFNHAAEKAKVHSQKPSLICIVAVAALTGATFLCVIFLPQC